MNREEIAMNQALLKEISDLKKNQPEKFSNYSPESTKAKAAAL